MLQMLPQLFAVVAAMGLVGASAATEIVPGYALSVRAQAIAGTDDAKLIEEFRKPGGHILIYSVPCPPAGPRCTQVFEFFNEALMSIHVYPQGAMDLDRIRERWLNLHGIESPGQLLEGVEVGGVRLVESTNANDQPYLGARVLDVHKRHADWVFDR